MHNYLKCRQKVHPSSPGMYPWFWQTRTGKLKREQDAAIRVSAEQTPLDTGVRDCMVPLTTSSTTGQLFSKILLRRKICNAKRNRLLLVVVAILDWIAAIRISNFSCFLHTPTPITLLSIPLLLHSPFIFLSYTQGWPANETALSSTPPVLLFSDWFNWCILDESAILSEHFLRASERFRPTFSIRRDALFPTSGDRK